MAVLSAMVLTLDSVPEQTLRILRTSGMTEVSSEWTETGFWLSKPSTSMRYSVSATSKTSGVPQMLPSCWPFGMVKFQPIRPWYFWSKSIPNAAAALKKAKKPELSQSLRVDTENDELASRAWQIIDILKKLDIRTLTDHDYLGQLYETFFRYTGGNTIGQYFTPRHIVDFMCDLAGVTSKDTVFDPACGTGGFLIGALKRMIRLEHLAYEEAITKVRDNVFGLELVVDHRCALRNEHDSAGGWQAGVIKGNCFTLLDYPSKSVDFALLNPPFPHKKKKTQKPAVYRPSFDERKAQGHCGCHSSLFAHG